MSDLPRLAYLTTLYPAASHTFIQREIAELQALGFEIETCSMRRPASEHLIGPQEQAAEKETFYIISTGMNPLAMLMALGAALCRPRRFIRALRLALRTSVPGVKGAVKQVAYFAEALILARHLQARGVAHIHNHFAGPSATVAVLTSSLSDIPYSYTLHGPADFYEPKIWRLDQKTAHAKFVACISNFARGQGLYFSHPDHWHKLHIVHCGVIPEQYDRPASATQRTGTQLLFVGRLAPVKGVRLLLDALAIARAEHPDLTLTIIGDGEDRALLEAHPVSQQNGVTFLGYQSQDAVAQAMADTDGLVLPSFAEGVPVVLMEAMAAGKPVICTQVAGVGELVTDGVSGFIVPAGDVPALAKKISWLASHPQDGAAMGQAGRKSVRDAFDIRQEAARLGMLFVKGSEGQIRPDPLTFGAAPAQEKEAVKPGQ